MKEQQECLFGISRLERVFQISETPIEKIFRYLDVPYSESVG